MMKLILNFNDEANEAVKNGADIEEVSTLPVREKIGRFKYVPEEQTDEEFSRLSVEISSELNDLLRREQD